MILAVHAKEFDSLAVFCALQHLHPCIDEAESMYTRGEVACTFIVDTTSIYYAQLDWSEPAVRSILHSVGSVKNQSFGVKPYQSAGPGGQPCRCAFGCT